MCSHHRAANGPKLAQEGQTPQEGHQTMRRPANSSHKAANRRASKTHKLNRSTTPLRGGFRL